MGTEAIVAIIGVGGTLMGGLVYAIRCWADINRMRVTHELKMEEKRAEREEAAEKRRDEREEKRAERELATATYIATNTEALKSVVNGMGAMKAALQEGLGNNGIEALLRANTERVARLESIIKEGQDSPGRP